MNFLANAEPYSKALLAQSPAPVFVLARSMKIMLDRLSIKYHSNIKKSNINLVFTMGKVGSTSIYESLRPHDLNGPLYHVHILTQRGLEQQKAAHRRDGNPRTLCHFQGEMLRREFLKMREQVRWNIVTVVREPIATVLSQAFYNPDGSLPHLRRQDGTIPVQPALEYIHRRLTKEDPSGWSVNTWFDTEFLESTGINVYNYKFNHDDGFVIIREGSINVLVLRLEGLDSSFARAMREFLDLDADFHLSERNVNDGDRNSEGYRYNGKKYSKLYEYIKNNLVLPREACHRVYSTRYSRHFYNENIISNYIHKWSGERMHSPQQGRRL